MSATSPQTFADALREVRDWSRLSQTRLAERAGIEHSFISRLESGDRVPSRETVLALVKAMGCHPDQRDRLLIAGGFAPLILDELPELRELLVMLSDDRDTALLRGVNALVTLARRAGREAAV